MVSGGACVWLLGGGEVCDLAGAYLMLSMSCGLVNALELLVKQLWSKLG